ncbi:GNAT family N-acetyltransferase [Liquorilactobacillus mali]|uniref:N-acetyltransferase GCN5 n=1 Tax=Liquorilactobacillus mali TaxID=1618 RepID=A0A0R2FQT0_9LACO|nr:GNAT family N-acetyltransferase [Liquorilactobacillus mali]KRN29958.1 N-acetyltransferase GCN5 [Liquorilactobacillus mali]
MISGNKILLRHVQLGDVDDLYEYSSQKEVAQAAGFIQSGNYSAAKDFYAELDNDLAWVIILKTGKVIGNVCLYEQGLDFAKQTEKRVAIGYALNNKYWNKGYMSEALILLVEWIKNNKMEIDVIEAYVTNQNIASQRVLEKVGFSVSSIIDVPYFDTQLMNDKVIAYEKILRKGEVEYAVNQGL